jgi:hypothetical protein
MPPLSSQSSSGPYKFPEITSPRRKDLALLMQHVVGVSRLRSEIICHLDRGSDLPGRGHARVRGVHAVGTGTNGAVKMFPQIRIVLS